MAGVARHGEHAHPHGCRPDPGGPARERAIKRHVRRYLEASDKGLHKYARQVSDLLAGHIRDAADDDGRVAAGLTELASYAYAYWKAEDWRFRNGERGDEISDDALDVFLDTLDELDRLSSDGYADPNTVNDALLAFMEAYSAGKPPLRPRKGTASAGTR